MKTVKSVSGGNVERVNDETAEKKVGLGTHKYCPKGEWKKMFKKHEPKEKVEKVEKKAKPEVKHEKKEAKG